MGWNDERESALMVLAWNGKLIADNFGRCVARRRARAPRRAGLTPPVANRSRQARIEGHIRPGDGLITRNDLDHDLDGTERRKSQGWIKHLEYQRHTGHKCKVLRRLGTLRANDRNTAGDRQNDLHGRLPAIRGCFFRMSRNNRLNLVAGKRPA